jgi:uncharacterized membrane protein YwaF
MENFLIQLRELLSATGEIPLPMGALHISSLIALAVALIIFVPIFCRAKDKTVKTICIFFWLALIIIELGKQFAAATSIEEGKLIFDYSLGALPLQICSSTFYILPVIFLSKKNFSQDVAAIFLCTFSLVGGLAVMAFPDSVFGGTIYTNFQSMIHHSIQILVGVCLGLRYGRRFSKDSFIGAAAAFLNLAAAALAANLISHEYFVQNGISSELNMFFISPYVRFVPPVLEGLGIAEMPYLAYLFSFLVLFIALAFILSLIFKLISKILTTNL